MNGKDSNEQNPSTGSSINQHEKVVTDESTITPHREHNSPYYVFPSVLGKFWPFPIDHDAPDPPGEKKETRKKASKQQRREQAATFEAKQKEDREKRLRELNEKMREEEENDRRMCWEASKKMEEKRLRTQKMLENSYKDIMKNAELHKKREEEEDQAMNRQLEELKQDYAAAADLEHRVKEQRIENIKKEGEEEMKRINNLREQAKLEREQKLIKQDTIFAENAEKNEIEREKRNVELLRKQADSEETIKQIHEKLERRREEMLRRHHERMNRMREQWEQIELTFKYSHWNEIIERNWTNRLNVLRSANRTVSDLFSRLMSQVELMKRFTNGSEDFLNVKNKVCIILNALIESVKPEKTMMEEEMENLRVQYENTGKMFVFVLKEAVEKVKWSCEQLEESLQEYVTVLNEEIESDHEMLLKQIKSNFDNLTKCSNSIPTLAELKTNESEKMESETTPNPERDVVSFQSVIIEEVE